MLLSKAPEKEAQWSRLSRRTGEDLNFPNITTTFLAKAVRLNKGEALFFFFFLGYPSQFLLSRMWCSHFFSHSYFIGLHQIWMRFFLFFFWDIPTCPQTDPRSIFLCQISVNLSACVPTSGSVLNVMLCRSKMQVSANVLTVWSLLWGDVFFFFFFFFSN